jgi:hypothetical protein
MVSQAAVNLSLNDVVLVGLSKVGNQVTNLETLARGTMRQSNKMFHGTLSFADMRQNQQLVRVIVLRLMQKS